MGFHCNRFIAPESGRKRKGSYQRSPAFPPVSVRWLTGSEACFSAALIWKQSTQEKWLKFDIYNEGSFLKVRDKRKTVWFLLSPHRPFSFTAPDPVFNLCGCFMGFTLATHLLYLVMKWNSVKSPSDLWRPTLFQAGISRSGPVTFFSDTMGWTAHHLGTTGNEITSAPQEGQIEKLKIWQLRVKVKLKVECFTTLLWLLSPFYKDGPVRFVDRMNKIQMCWAISLRESSCSFDIFPCSGPTNNHPHNERQHPLVPETCCLLHLSISLNLWEGRYADVTVQKLWSEEGLP